MNSDTYDVPVLTDVLDDLLKVREDDEAAFLKMYPNLPFSFYYDIEQLAVSRSIEYKDLCHKAKLVANYFHKAIK